MVNYISTHVLFSSSTSSRKNYIRVFLLHFHRAFYCTETPSFKQHSKDLIISAWIILFLLTLAFLVFSDSKYSTIFIESLLFLECPGKHLSPVLFFTCMHIFFLFSLSSLNHIMHHQQNKLSQQATITRYQPLIELFSNILVGKDSRRNCEIDSFSVVQQYKNK